MTLSITHKIDYSRLLSNKTENLLADFRPGYSWLSDLRRGSKLLLWLAFMIFGIFLQASYLLKWQELPLSPNLKTFAWGIFIVNIPTAFTFVGASAFPRSSFLIGGGKQRNARSFWIRNVFLSGLALAVVGGAITSILL